ncbi:hypothetical protein RHSIM_Rhsim09G0193800 [Rhododendron simsii]|uniref:AT-hook motif nuclear-localized protein n=1 Tax=Rhododendron simsii TaxID=118357 RepID=A0A834GG33_RHOSS|nr:hypothetical protein RHSIM_Rhsim09G0193800 [Rhododendron simsii]
MEGEAGINSYGVTKKGEEAPGSFHVAPRIETPTQLTGSTVAPRIETPTQLTGSTVAPRIETPTQLTGSTAVVTTATPVSVAAATAATPVSVAPVPVAVVAPPVGSGTEGKKKRGRPRKYAPDGSVLALSPMPISASIPLTGDYSSWKQGRGRPVDSFKKKHKLEFESPGGHVAYSVGANFTPHVITINAGEDVNMKIISFSQQGSRAICVLSANGAISNVTLRQPNSSGGTLTYEGRFEILSLTGSFMPTDSGGTKSISGGMSVSLAGPDGRVLGGGLAGLLIAAGPIQVRLYSKPGK